MELDEETRETWRKGVANHIAPFSKSPRVSLLFVVR